MLFTPRLEKLSGDQHAANVATMKENAQRAHREHQSCINSTNISSRAEDLKLAAREFEAVMSVWSDIYHPDENPNGIFSLGVAENSLMHDEISKFLNENMKIVPFCHTYGDGPAGNKKLRKHLCNFFDKYFKAATPMQVEHMQISSGVTSIINNLVYSIADEGDGILIGRPLYSGFCHDLQVRNKVHLVPVTLKEVDPFGLEAVHVYEDVLRAQNRNGFKIKGMILCNPHNPLGRCYPREVIIAYMKLCEKFQIHFISDEVYALSTFETEETKKKAEPFVSALSIDTEGVIDSRLVTVVYGMSKDFSSNGFRCAALINQHNPELLAATGTVGPFSWSSSLSDLAWSTILESDSFLSYYIPENQRRLANSYSILTDFLQKYEIPYEPTYAGFFVWCDFRKFLPPLPQLKEGEELKLNRSKIPGATDKERWRDDEFYRRLLRARLYLSTSSAFYGEQHGWYRITFSLPEKELRFGLDRLEKLVIEAKEGWKNDQREINGTGKQWGDSESSSAVNGINGVNSQERVEVVAEVLKNVSV